MYTFFFFFFFIVQKYSNNISLLLNLFQGPDFTLDFIEMTADKYNQTNWTNIIKGKNSPTSEHVWMFVWGRVKSQSTREHQNTWREKHTWWVFIKKI